MNGDGAPHSELVLRQPQQMSDRREQDQRHRIEQEHYAERHRNFLLRSVHGRSHRRNRAAAADSRPGSYQVRRFARHPQPAADEITER